ncbi:MAG: hypothetical protein M3Z35_05080 [Nitrospirota bacterium]|nr:hypothetical protein [Nitrospirota bacterium]
MLFTGFQHRTVVSPPSFPRTSRRPSKLGEQLERKKFDEARRLTPEQRLLLALDLSDAAAALHDACSKKRVRRSTE